MGKVSRDSLEAEWTAAGRAVSQLSEGLKGSRVHTVPLTGMSVRAPQVEFGEMLLVLRSVDEEGRPIVAFHSATTLGDLLRGAVARMDNGSLKWRDDQYAGQ